MTGRKGRVIQSEDGQIRYESRSEVDLSLETINLTGIYGWKNYLALFQVIFNHDQ